MNPRRVVYAPRAERDLNALPASDRSEIMDAVKAWARGEPHVDVKKLTGVRPPQWRIRVGRWRALLDCPKSEIARVLRVLDRKDAYRR